MMENKNGYIKNSRNIGKLSRLAKVNNLESYSVDWPFWSSRYGVRKWGVRK
jgi:hypothetical protein